ncbi:hypothetical protein QYE76_031189 [Lolium multiflorum]|uniref:Alpha-carbonic anhydrase domain-containing protein n=1 Tax=Lolium multiflorum TaxID=4521 RepID=A0AAD8QRA6_LOLMU|nr:hypothetical protein QYE76_031189 [Lolium multiflorum]
MRQGSMQSPIDLASPRVSPCATSATHHSYRPAQASIINRGHDIMLNFEGDAGSVTINGTVYYLKQLHWHSPTEHSVNGRRYDLELHMLHQSAEKKAAVIGVFYEIGAHDAFPPQAGALPEMIASRRTEEKVGVMDPRAPGAGASVYHDMGSHHAALLGWVIWTIVRVVRTVSRSQLELLRTAVHDGCFSP